jgi:hypothetical protein
MVIFHSTGIGNIPAYSYVQFTPQASQSGYSWETGGFNVSNNDSIYFFDSQRQLLTSEKVENNNYQYVLGKSLLRMNARTYNRSNQVIFHDFPSLGSFNHQRGERNKGTVYYKLTQDAVVVKSGSFVNRTSDQFVTVNNVEHGGASGEYTLSLNYEGNNVKGKVSTALANLKFDMNSADKNPPSLQFLSLEANGMSTNHLETGHKGKIRFGISDVCLSYYGMECSDENSGIQSLELQIKNETESEWINLAVIESSSSANNFEKYESDIPNALANGYYELKIKATDLSNNSIEYQLKPAFLIGPASSENYTHVSLLEPKQDAYGTGSYPTFKWNAVDNATVYVIQISQSSSFDDVIESSSTSPTYQHDTPLNNDQFYFWRVKAFTGNSSTAWSNVGSFYTGNPFQPALPVSPANGSLDQATSLSFKWIRAKNQEPYAKFELSTTPDFSYYSYLNYTSDSVLTVNENIYPNGQYYWRITTTHYFNNKYYEVTSPTFTFNTFTTNSIALIAPIQGAYAVGSSPYFLWGKLPNAHHYVFQISDNNFNSLMSEQVVYTNELRLPFKLGENKYYYWRVAMVDNQNTMWSETRNFFTGDPYQPVTLVQPLNQSAEQPLSVEFNWKRTFDNQNYIFQLSNTQDFSSIYHEQILSDTLTRVDNLQPSQQYFWRVMHSRTFNENNFTVTSPTYSFRTTSITDAADPLSEGKLVGYPNPFVDEVFIRFYTKKPGLTSLTIVDSFGRPVKQFTYEAERAGLNTVRWNGANEKNEKLSSGIYFVILQMAENTDQIKIVLAK